VRQSTALLGAGVILWLLGLDSARAIPVPPEPIPVSRLVASLTDRISKNPDDVQAVFTLGRVHYFAFSGTTDSVNVVRFREESAVPTLYDFLGERGRGMAARARATRPVTEAERLLHLKNALTYLSRAVSMKQTRPVVEDGRYELCLACALEEGARFAPMVGPIAGIAPTPTAWTDAAILNYGLAFDRAVERDSQIKSRPAFGLSTLVSYETARSYQRLVRARDATPTAAEQSRLDRMVRFLDAMKGLPPGAVTPLVFAIDRKADLPGLLSTRTVAFDLNGSNLPQQYAWVRSDTGILVWDPERSGRITSGRQLFGSVTWWMFWDDAYQVLRVLDDDGNGWVEGPELAGLALWFDRDEDALSDAGEVIPIEATPIAAIATHAAGRTGDAPMNAAGLRLVHGGLLPTYDWIAIPK
jgi:hypothetical protein